MRSIIVNADDFGLTRGTSLGIMWAFREGLVTSTTIMATGTDFAQSAKLAKFAKIPVGLHLCLSYGRPVFNPRDIRSLVDEKGFFKKIEDLQHDKPQLHHVEKEWRAQIAALKAAGIHPDHLDSHHYVNEVLGDDILGIFAKLARELNVPARHTKEYAKEILRAKNVKTPDFFCGSFYGEHVGAKDIMEILSQQHGGVTELMCHPGQYDGAIDTVSSYSRGREVELRALLAPEVIDYARQTGIKFISFADLL